jgi:hypothetical protein
MTHLAVIGLTALLLLRLPAPADANLARPGDPSPPDIVIDER